MTSVQHHRTFGPQPLPHTVIIARGDSVRHFSVGPRLLALATALGAVLVVGMVAGLASLAMGDDLLSSSARQAGLQRAYEDRIATLRTELDRVVSRQFLDQQTVETKVDSLIGQQAELAARYEKLQPLLDRARSSGLLPTEVPLPRPKPTEASAGLQKAAPSPDASAYAPLAFAKPEGTPVLARFASIDSGKPGIGWLRASLASDATTTASRRKSPGDLIREIGQSIDTAGDRQVAGLTRLAEIARTRTAAIASVLRAEGIGFAVPGMPAGDAQGGPFVEVPETRLFEVRYEDLDAALTALQGMHQTTEQLPLAAPVESTRISSIFGPRADPFLGRSAMHTGTDFVARSGTRVVSAASGVIVHAGYSGGYGNLVEIDHGGGVTTRYAHMASILVAAGDRVRAGDAVGTVGSTGRSTGPHLHYEVRRQGESIDPARFLRAGRKIAALG